MASVTTVDLTGDQNLDALLWGTRWEGAVATYGFPDAKESYGEYGHGILNAVNETNGFQPLNGDQKQAARSTFTTAESYIDNLAFVEQPPAGSADMRLAMSNTLDGDGSAYGFPPGFKFTILDDARRGGDVWFNTADYNNSQLGNKGYYGFLHEIGHALGLKHGHIPIENNEAVLAGAELRNPPGGQEGDQDSHEFSVMTYHSYTRLPYQPANEIPTNADGHFPQTYMMLDIKALQHMYGADYTTQSGDTSYSFDPDNGEMKINGEGTGVPKNNAGDDVNVIFRTVWDGGGTDTYDFSSYGSDRALDINLEPGGWSDVDSDSHFQAANLGGGPNDNYARGQVFNALLYDGDPRSLIENAIGGAGDDIINGNQANNRIEGRSGSDTLSGGAGDDIIESGPDSDPINVDIMTGGPGKDQFWSSSGSDVIKDFNPDEDSLWLPEDTEGWFNAWANTTVLTYLNGTVALEGVDLGPHVAAKEYPWLEWHEDMPLIA